MYNTNISVELSSSWKDTQIEIKQELKEPIESNTDNPDISITNSESTEGGESDEKANSTE